MFEYANQQLDRVKRFHERVKDNRNKEVLPYEDDVISFFMHCWHLKDFIEYDPDCSDRLKRQVEKFCEKSEELQICRDLCHRSKHLQLNDSKRDADLKGRTISIYTNSVHIAEDGTQETVGEAYGEVLVHVETDFCGIYGKRRQKFNIDAIDLAGDLMNIWSKFLKDNKIY